MIQNQEPPDPDRLLGLRRQYRRDVENGTPRSLRAYIELFDDLPDAVVEDEYLRLRYGQPSAITAGASSVVLPRDPGEALGGGRYRILEELGRGGQGRVYRAVDLELDRIVAVKVLTARDSGPALERFRREAKVASRLEHPGICAVHDFGVDDGLPYLVLQHLVGRTLGQIVAGQEEPTSVFFDIDDPRVAGSGAPDTLDSVAAIDVTRMVTLLEKAARAVHFAHERGVIHRDIKPNNIMITPEGEPVMMDFGMARDDRDGGPTLTRSTELFGTLTYMAPEQLERGSERVDARADVWSLGVSLYEALTLIRPFDAPTPSAIIAQIENKDPVPPRLLNPNVSRDLSVVVMCALEKGLPQRYRSAFDLAEDLARARQGFPVLARPASLLRRFVQWYGRNRALGTSLVGLFVILLAGVVTASLLAGEARHARQRAERKAADNLELADGARVDELSIRAKSLWPARAERRAELESWLADARGLLVRESRHRAALEDLQTRGHADEVLVLDEEERERLAALDAEIAAGRAWLMSPAAAGAERAAAEAGAVLEDRVRRADELRRSAASRRIARFTSVEDGARHDRLAALLEGLARLGADATAIGSVAEIETRLARALDLERTSLVEPAERWAAVARHVAASRLYGGLELKPQLGLIPLPFETGPDEPIRFEHVATRAEGDEERDRGIVLILVPGGRFQIGSPEGERGRGPDEVVHEVVLRPFFLAAHELSVPQWRRIMGGPSDDGPLFPIAGVSWDDCREFARRADLVLPTEAQWEVAARCGSDQAFPYGATPDCLEGRSNLADQSFRSYPGAPEDLDFAPWTDGAAYRAPIGAVFPPNAWGFYNLAGNVSEWCRDDYGPYDTRPNPIPGTGLGVRPPRDVKVARGGSFVTPGLEARCAHRASFDRATRSPILGVRLARQLDE